MFQQLESFRLLNRLPDYPSMKHTMQSDEPSWLDIRRFRHLSATYGNIRQIRSLNLECSRSHDQPKRGMTWLASTDSDPGLIHACVYSVRKPAKEGSQFREVCSS